MDIWFWVNDWYSWTGIYILIGAMTSRTIFKNESEWKAVDGKLQLHTNKSDTLSFSVIGFFTWPIILPFAIMGKHGTNISNAIKHFLAGRPSKEIKRAAHEQKIDKLLEE